MPVISREAASQTRSIGGFDIRYEDVDGYTVAFESQHRDTDLSPLYRGLPGDRCQAAHWGVVLAGKVIFHFPSGDEVAEAGQAFYAPPGHIPQFLPGTEVIEFSPTTQQARMMGVVMENLAAARS